MLTDHFEVLVGWTVRVPTEDGIDVFHVLTNPNKADTDGDGLEDGGEYKHTFNGSPAPPTDPNDFDSDSDGKTDGQECSNQAAVLAGCTNPTTQSLATCSSDPLVADKKVTIRYTQLTVDRGNDEVGANTVDMSWRFQAQHSTEDYPGAWYGVRTDRAACVAIGADAWCYQGGYCSVPEGTDFVFQGPHCQYLGDPRVTNLDCGTLVGHCSLFSFIQCTADSQCPFNFLGETCAGRVRDDCLGGNEVVFTLKPGEGILLNGEASQYNDCIGAECAGGPYAGDLCDPFNVEATCCPRYCDEGGALCRLDSECPRYCTGTTDACTDDGDCTDPDTCDQTTCGAPVCTGINCESPFADNHVIYTKSLSYETLQFGFSVEVARLTDANDAQQFSLTLIVEIIVE